MVDVTMVLVGVCDSSAVHVADMFQYDNAHILTAWTTISWKTACTYQWAINTAMSDEDQVSSKWLKNATVQVMHYGDEGGADA
jgi:hypothetical protein